MYGHADFRIYQLCALVSMPKMYLHIQNYVCTNGGQAEALWKGDKGSWHEVLY